MTYQYKLERRDLKLMVLSATREDSVDPVQRWAEAPPEDLVRSMQDWCDENKCGRRMSYDQFHFKNEKELMLFMLRWS